MALSFDSVCFSYPSSIEPVLQNISVEFRPCWTGITGDNGAGKTTFLMLAAGLLKPRSGKIAGSGGVYCPQRTDDLSDGWEDFFYAAGNEAGRIMSRLGIEADWPFRWNTLSHGERKRMQIAIALWRQPEILAMDEPTNHLDTEAAELVAGALKMYHGTGLLVSHDRALLDLLCGQCLFIRQGTGILRPGGISQGLAEEERENLEMRRVRKRLVNERERFAAAADARRRMVEGSKNRLSKKHLDPKDKDARGTINLARLSGKDRIGADLYKRMENRLARLDANLENAALPVQRKYGVTLETSQAKMDRLCAIPAGTLPLGGGRSLSFPELLIRPGDRIALTGPNGAGKSTLIRFIVERPVPAPDALRAPALYIPQEVSAEESRTALEALEQESERRRGEILSRFSRLGSDPGLLRRSQLPSPGEIRKLLIARGVFSNPALIIMDEPTNHLDIRSIRLLEETLNEVSCAMLLSSHDAVFLSRLTGREWAITRDGRMAIRAGSWQEPR
ncbi:MAG: ATP-binding cassette domain-containing protein [Treponema sp.]|jgi:ATPase subunit of ABC transporter with duplicated ATPase domains|nr:ATP-binding cassette domain-containing protein [Treponema sp.]